MKETKSVKALPVLRVVRDALATLLDDDAHVRKAQLPDSERARTEALHYAVLKDINR